MAIDVQGESWVQTFAQAGLYAQTVLSSYLFAHVLPFLSDSVHVPPPPRSHLRFLQLEPCSSLETPIHAVFFPSSPGLVHGCYHLPQLKREQLKA